MRIGISPQLIIDKLHATRKKFLLPNLLMNHGGGCLENCPVPATTLNEMALSADGGIIKFFPHWDTRLDCEFHNLRANGAFLVSAKINGGIISDISVFSEVGGELTFANPFNRCRVNGKEYDTQIVKIITVAGEEFKIENV